MGEQAEKCRRKAVECESTALHSPYQEIRLAYLELAHLWRQIAAQVETLDRRVPHANRVPQANDDPSAAAPRSA
jgi:hypothetical protein